jgi:hypothetical protein
LLWAVASVAWAAEPGSDPWSRPSNLKGIRQALGLLLANAFVVSLVLGHVALMLMAAAASPGRVARAERVLRRGRWAAVFLGVGVTAALFVLAMACGSLAAATAGLLGFVALALLVVLYWLVVIGLAAAARIVGSRLLGERGQHSSWRLVGAGGLAIAGTLLIPILGWVYFLYIACQGVGAATLTLFTGATPPTDAVELEEVRDEPPAAAVVPPSGEHAPEPEQRG